MSSKEERARTEHSSNIPAYDQYHSFCDELNRGFEEMDPSYFARREDYDAAIALRRYVGAEPVIRMGVVYTMSDSRLYNSLSAMEGLGDDDLDKVATQGKALAGVDEQLTGEELINDVGRLATDLQAKIDSEKPMDVTVRINHVYVDPFSDTVQTVRAKAEELGGRILADDELTGLQRFVINMEIENMPFNFQAGFIVRFDS